VLESEERKEANAEEVLGPALTSDKKKARVTVKIFCQRREGKGEHFEPTRPFNGGNGNPWKAGTATVGGTEGT